MTSVFIIRRFLIKIRIDIVNFSIIVLIDLPLALVLRVDVHQMIVDLSQPGPEERLWTTGRSNKALESFDRLGDGETMRVPGEVHALLLAPDLASPPRVVQQDEVKSAALHTWLER